MLRLRWKGAYNLTASEARGGGRSTGSDCPGLLLPQKPCLLSLSGWESGEVSFLSPSSSVLWLMGETTQKAQKAMELLSVLNKSA